jgi:Short-chain alcohol dehydrogenase of unknown specificity
MAQTWLITGTSTGFGQELATLLAQKTDVNLVATARNTDKLAYLDQYDHGQILKLELDVTDSQQIKEVIQTTLSKFGRIDVLDNNAGWATFRHLRKPMKQQSNTCLMLIFGAQSI